MKNELVEVRSILDKMKIFIKKDDLLTNNAWAPLCLTAGKVWSLFSFAVERSYTMSSFASKKNVQQTKKYKVIRLH